jgi:hypothetical protein
MNAALAGVATIVAVVPMGTDAVIVVPVDAVPRRSRPLSNECFVGA